MVRLSYREKSSPKGKKAEEVGYTLLTLSFFFVSLTSFIFEEFNPKPWYDSATKKEFVKGREDGEKVGYTRSHFFFCFCLRLLYLRD